LYITQLATVYPTAYNVSVNRLGVKPRGTRPAPPVELLVSGEKAVDGAVVELRLAAASTDDGG
jgi:hypothetical protein